MSEYEHSILINEGPEEIFAFVSNLNNLPKYLPSIRQSFEEPYGMSPADFCSGQSDGWVRVDPTEYFLEWGSDGENFYTGRLEIEEVGEFSEVTVHLSFQPKSHPAPAAKSRPADCDIAIEQGLKAAMQSIKHLVERTSGRTQPQFTS